MHIYKFFIYEKVLYLHFSIKYQKRVFNILIRYFQIIYLNNFFSTAKMYIFEEFKNFCTSNTLSHDIFRILVIVKNDAK